MTPHEVRIKDLTPSGLRELADANCTIWAQSVHDPTVLIFLKPDSVLEDSGITLLETKKEEEANG